MRAVQRSSREGQLALSTLLLRAADAEQKMRLDGLSLPAAIDAVSADLPPKAKAAVQSILYAGERRRALSEAVFGKLVAMSPGGLAADLIRVSIALLFAGAYKNYALLDQTVRALRTNPKTARYAGLANAVLRRILREGEGILASLKDDESVRFNAPSWWIERVKKDHPECWRSILSLAAEHPPMTLRVNRRRIERAEYMKHLEKAGIAAMEVGEDGVVLEKPCPVHEVPGFNLGLVSVQDAGAQLAAGLLRPEPKSRVLDACAAPGGKAAHILERFDVSVDALEIDAKRTRLIESTLKRLGLSANVRTADAADLESWWDKKPYDAVLLDAPCTASGIVRRQPDVPWSRQPGDIASLAEKQRALLDSLWRVVRPGGRLLFCTCSIFPEEGSMQVRRFLEAHPDAKLTPLRRGCEGMMILIPTDARKNRAEAAASGPNETLPEVHDGFFYALLEKEA